MPFISRSIKTIMVISGALTLTMIYALIAPAAALQGMFGQNLSGPIAEIVVRNWGALIAIGGATLLWGAFHPAVRSLVLVTVGTSKLVFVGLALAYGWPYLTGQAMVALGFDAICVAAFAAYLLANQPTQG